MEKETHVAIEVADLVWECPNCTYKIIFDQNLKQLRILDVGNVRFAHDFERDWLDPYRQHFQEFDK